jgi:phenylpropionate dioxygenase-like ring-hydroxylating dioxygenase large terminal subunit
MAGAEVARPSREEIRRLVEPNRVHRAIYVDPAIFALEIERIFERSWIYVGHESQLPNPGDYLTAQIGRQPVIMVRHDDGSLRILYNRCGHRGARLVVEAGNLRHFRCCYHGWTFRTDGTVLSVPLRRGYDGTAFDPNDPAFSIPRVARVDSYQGFVFASLAAQGPDLRTFLGGIASSLDDMVDRAPGGRIEIAGRPFRFIMRSNWKLFLENLNDTMHALSVHESAIESARTQLSQMNDPEVPAHSWVGDTLSTIGKNGTPQATMDQIGVAGFPHGHSFMGGFFNPDSYERPYVAALEQQYGAARMREILSVNRHNSIVYPSMTVQAAFHQLRVIRPLAVDRTQVEAYTFRLIGAPAETYRRTMAYAMLMNTPSSNMMPDDLEALYRVQQGLTVAASDWVSLHRNAGHEVAENGSISGTGTSELPIRNQSRAWLDLMTAED